ncbi:MAG: type II secretion system secretin GspD [Deltaproteobacteria bacterium]|nr:type II secretion system secretin GspD [Deltaproteobacteria bacterium]
MKSTRLITLFVLVTSASALAQPAGSGAPPASSDDQPVYVCKHATGTVAVNFKPESELKDLITWAMGFTCKNFILDPRIVSTGKKVTVIAPNKMNATDAYRLFLASLSTMGLTVVPKGNALRIVESATAKSETVPILKKGVPADEDQMIRYVLRPSYVQTETMRAALDSIRSPAGNVQTAGNILIITDYASQVRDMMSLAKTIDVQGGSDSVWTIPVKNADATQLAQKLNDILGITAGGAGGPGQPGGGRGGMAPPGGKGGGPAGAEDVSGAVPSKILVDDRTNTLIVVASEAGYQRVKALVDRLDILLDTEGGSAIRVYPLENALAKDLAQTLNNALQGRNQQQGGTQGRPGQPGAPAPAPASNVGDLGAALEGQVRVVNDDPTNSLIVMSSGRDYLAIKNVIRDLDKPRRQIFIEALILEVQLNKELDIGTSSHGGLPVNGGDSLILGGVQAANGPKSLNPASLASLSGLIGGILGSPLTNSQTFLGTSIPSYAVLFQALATQDNTNILSAPHIIAIDNEKAEFSVGNNIPYQAGLSFGGFGLPTTGQTGSTGLPAGSIGQNIQREKLTLDLNVTPHISSNDAVRLEIEQNTKDLGGKDPQLGPTWTERKLKTQVVVHDQESVVIGGLIQEREVYSVSKVPLLGDIPLLGYLFKYSTKQRKKTNLLILLTPYIIKDQLDLQSIRERKEREYHEFTASFANLNEAKYEPKIDYRRKRGLVEEINRSIQSVEEDMTALGAAGHRQHVTEGAVEYGPTTIEAPDQGGHGDGTSAPVPDAPKGGGKK